MNSNLKEYNLSSSELINFLIKNKDKIKSEIIQNGYNSSESTISLTLVDNNIKFLISSFINHQTNLKEYYIGICKDVVNTDYLSNINVSITDAQYITIKDEFVYTREDLEIELKRLIRGDKLDDVLGN